MELKNDRLKGAKAIADFMGEDPRRIFYLLEQRLIPAFKLGGRWNARKSTLLKHIEKLESEALEGTTAAAAVEQGVA